MKNRLFKTLGGLVFLLSFLFLMKYLIINSIIPLIKIEDRIIFSSSIAICLISFPLMFYVMTGSIYFFIFNKTPKFNKLLIKYLTMLAIASFIMSFPIPFYIDYKLKNDGYVVCDRISWMSPNTYVKDLSLCK
ncbi:DUF1240 domain-containing protein [Yersinia pseudotuberculosis]|uniref:DUF1240 domain-containing protein n=3 Tax=Yersinia pseudotuberculosis TaxID=633 RepID=Q668B0_YERPS|nr:DUF1240 domain-containing protein [Yersinia pseudotuberculosis]MBO1608927.1 DUF1240 domain-containing protein [Yersinia pseudotuberculosis]MBO1613022.1 DUF1240 domain-containing protein [Yersinia pseudotuberculosis]MBO1623398.1 DUF1240 domain-containing protein [Yersinia pseudotuberculosis]PSH14017.1 hypothetical protein BLA52_17985 [Yersinia pseudotuberculosis]PSH25634.1 hypothetical protein BLA50_11910 [Yersinia pseudotuberculosis]